MGPTRRGSRAPLVRLLAALVLLAGACRGGAAGGGVVPLDASGFGDLPAVVVNLDRDTERLSQAAAEFERESLVVHRVPAVNGRALRCVRHLLEGRLRQAGAVLTSVALRVAGRSYLAVMRS